MLIGKSQLILLCGKSSGTTICGEKLVQIKNVSMDGDGDDVAGNSRKRLLKALEARHMVLHKEQGMSFARAAAAGFDNEHLMELIIFSDCFGALRLRKACIQFMALCKKRQKTGLWMEDVETVARIQLDRPLITMMKPRISIKTSSGSNGGDSSVLEEGCNELTNDSEDNFIGAGRTGTPGECFGNCTRSGKKSPMAATLEEHSPASGNHRGAERFTVTGTVTGVPFTSGWCGLIQKHVCHEALLQGSQVDQKTLTSFCLASCEDSNSSCLSVSKISNSNQINQATPSEPLQIFVSDASMDCSCAKSHKSLFSQESSVDLPKLLSNHDHFHTLTKRCFAHEDPNPRQQNLALPLKQMEHGHETPSDMVVVQNQLFTATNLLDPPGNDDRANSFSGNCWKDHMCAMETKADLRPDPSQVSVRDVVSIFERKCREEPENGDGCPKQECYASENFQKLRKNILERWNARVFVDETCHKDGTTEKRKDEGSLSEINLSYGRERRVHGMAPYEVGTSSSRKCTGLQGSLDSTVFNNSEPQKREEVGSPYSDTSAAPLHSAFHEGSSVPRRTTLRVECKMKAKENHSGTSVIRIKTDDIALNPPGPFIIPSIEKDPACTCWDGRADNCTHSLPHPSLLNQSLDISKPSEERVKKFLDRYNEKRESKMRNLSSSKRKEREVNLEGMEKILEKKKEEMNRNHKSEKLIVLDDPSLRAEKLRAYKAGLQKKKDKEGEERRRLEEMKVRRRERVSSLKSSTSAAPSALPAPHCLSTQRRLNSKLSPRLQKSAAPVKSSVSGPSLKQKGATGLLSADSCKSGGSKKLRNPLTRSAPSEIQRKVERTTNMRASTGSQFTPEDKGIGQMRIPLHSKDKSTITATNAENRKNCQVSKAFTRNVKPSAADTKGKGVCADKNGKDFSVHSCNITEPKQAPRSFLKKGSGARSRVGGGVSKSRFVSKDTVATHHKRHDAVLSPPSKLQSVGMGLGQQAQDMPMPPQECSMPPQAGGIAGTDSQLSSAKNGSGLFGGSIDGFELAAQQVSAEALGGKLSVSSVSPCDLSCQDLQRNPTVDRKSRSAHPKMSYEGTMLTISLTNMKPTFVAHTATEGKYQTCGSQMPSDPSSEDALSGVNALFKACAPTEPLPVVHDNPISQTFDLFRTPAAPGTEISTASSSQSRSTNLVSSGMSDVSRTEFQQFGTKWGTSRYISFIEPHTPTNSQGKDLKRFLKFGRKSIHGHGHDHSDQVSTSIFSEGDEDRGSFSEPGSNIVDCYGRKRHSSGKTFNLRASCNDMHHCSASPTESGGSRNLKTMMALKRSVSTHEIRTKSQDGKNSKTSAVKATRAFFSLAPFRRKAVEVKS